jgi:large subunit ribosomal protein L15
MKLDNLPKTKVRSAKRVGRGIGSGKGGHTSSRGTKGQKARGKVPIIFEGTKIKKSLIKRLPFNRGRGKLKPWGGKITILSLNDFAEWPKNQIVNEDNLIKNGYISKGERVKILGTGKITTPLEIENIKMSSSAREMIVAAGGKVSE